MVDRLYDIDASVLTLPFLIDHVEETRRFFGSDYWAYGVDPHLPALEVFAQYGEDQGLALRVVSTDELFPQIAR